MLLLWLVIGLPVLASAQKSIEVVQLWPGAPPGNDAKVGSEQVGTKGAARGAYTNISVPRMEVVRPAKPNGAAVLVIGGGGYHRIQIGSASRPLARRLAGEGITAFVLFYRLPADGWNADAPFQDGQRAMRMIRANAKRWSIDPARLGTVGFSAGGHLAGILATRGADPFYQTSDRIDSENAVPAFAGLIYPVASLMPPLDTTQSAKNLKRLGNPASWSVEKLVSPVTPPMFIAHAADDPIADVAHSQQLYSAMRAAKRSVELHLFNTGGHSWGLGKPDQAVALWPEMFLRWGHEQGWLRNSERSTTASVPAPR